MSIDVEKSADDSSITFNIRGRFDFSLHREFRKAYQQVTGSGTHFLVDLSNTDYMDSSALGMLLLLKEYAENHKGEITISNPRQNVKDILNLANFHKLFTITN